MSLLWFSANPWLAEVRVPADAVVRPAAPLSGQIHQKHQNASAASSGRRVRRSAVRAARRANRGRR